MADPRRLGPRSIRTKILLVFVVGFVGPVLGAAFWSYRTARGIIYRHSLRQQAEILDESARDLLALQEQARQELDHLARDAALVAALREARALPEPLLEAFYTLNPRWTELTLYDAHGRSVWARPSEPSGGLDPLFLDAVVRGRVQTPVESGADGRRTRFGARIDDRQQLRGVVAGTLDLAVIDPAFRRLRAFGATRAVIWDDRGLVFGSNLGPGEERELDAVVDLRSTGREVLAAADERVHRQVTLGGAALLLVASSVPETISSVTSEPGEHWFLATLAPASQAFGELRAFQLRIAVFLVLVCAAVAAFLVWISRRVSGPLLAMTGFAEAVAGGRRDLRVGLAGGDEIGRLARSLDAMTDSLARYESELVGKEALLTLGRTSALVAHEIRNPLNGIRGSIQYLQLRFPDNPVIDEYAQLMLDRVDRLTRFVDSLLRFARLPAPHPAPWPVRELFGRAIEPWVERARSTGIRLLLEPGEIETIVVDGDQIVELLSNLVHNALDAVGGEGAVGLAASRTGSSVELRVRDSGPGLDPALRGRLFVPFSSTKSQGTGLGLVMCRMIAENHGGTLEPEQADGGAVFVVRLPQPPRPAPP